ncbi:MAG: alpha-glucosidase [Bacillota bacterium]
MIELKTTETTLELYHQGKRVLSHTEESPAFYLGEGTCAIEMYRGNYDIEDYIATRIPLKHFEVDGHTITFKHYDASLEVRLVEDGSRLFMKFEGDASYNRFWMRIPAEKEEGVYGCGEQASYFNLRGRNFPLFTSEPGVGRDKHDLTTFYSDLYDKAGGDYYTTYYPEPTFISTRKYWCHLDTFAYADFNFKHEDFHELHAWEIPSAFVFESAESYVELIERLTDYTGRPPKLPDFLHDGIILGLQDGRDIVTGHMRKAKDAGVKVSGIWAQDWVGHNHTTLGKRLYWNWKWNEKLYPEPRTMIASFEKEDVAFLTYVSPFLLVGESLYETAEESGYLALNKEGGTYKVDFGEFECGIIDLTHPDAFDWFKGVIQETIIDYGVKGWMADFGEYLPTDAVLHNGVPALIMHNEWPVLWARLNYEAVKEKGKLGEVFYFMRAGNHGSQKYSTCMWNGDQSVNWNTHDGIPSVIPSSLSMGVIGVPYTHSDIGGYTSIYGNIRTKELFERWLELSVFSAFMRTHEGNRPNENFQFYHDDETLSRMARMSTLRVMMKPYVKAIVEEASQKGLPLQRPLFMHYEEDMAAYAIQDSFLFGPDVLVAPVLKEGATTRTVHLPNDEWVHLFTKKTYHGGDHTVDAPIGYPPVFYRKHSPYRSLFDQISDDEIKG